MSAFGIDFAAAVAKLEEKRAADLIRYVDHEVRDDPALGIIPFKDGWNIMVGRYVEHVAVRS